MIEEGVVARLQADAGVSALIASRVYPVLAPELLSLFPCVTYQVISNPSDNDLVGDTGFAVCRIQMDAWAQSYGVCKSIARALGACLSNCAGELTDEDATLVFSVQRVNVSDQFESDTRMYRVMSDFLFQYIES
jgi:hypothetical protein